VLSPPNSRSLSPAAAAREQAPRGEAADVKEDADQEAIAARARVKTKFGKGTRPSPTPKKRTAVETTKATKPRTPSKRTAAKATELPTDKVLQDPTISVAAWRRFFVVRLRAKQFHQGRMVWVFVYSTSTPSWSPHLVHAIIEMAQIQDKIETEKLCKDDVLKLITPRRPHTRR